MEVSIKDLKARQAWTLSQKIDHALATIDVFVSRLGGLDKVYFRFLEVKTAQYYYTFAGYYSRIFLPCFARQAMSTPK